jgi:tetratricopeptide (TPR) repeat protein
MKNFFLGLLVFFAFAQMTNAQDDPEKTLTKAGRALGSYNVDPSNNADKLQEAVELITLAEAAEINQSKLKLWQVKGEIYNALADKDLTAMMMNAEGFSPQHPDAPITAGSAFIKALELAVKKYEKKDALDGLSEAASKLNNLGNYFIQAQDYAQAAKVLDFVIVADAALRQNEGKPAIQDTSMDNHKYVVAFCASASGNSTRASELFKELYDAGSDEPNVYASYANLLMKEGDEAGALAVLEKGRAKFPSSTDILFASINYYISKQQFDMLETLLKEAIAAEPNNPSIYTALGNVYLNLFNQEFSKGGDSDLSKKYFDESLSYFSQASEIDPNQFDAVYSIGSLYFNKAVELIKRASSLGLSKADQEKYSQLIKQSGELMSTALPYFQKTESLEPNDTNTLIALSEIYARMDDLEKSKLFKERLQVVREGGRHSSSYFKF